MPWDEIPNPEIQYPRDQINEDLKGYTLVQDYWLDKLAHYDELEITRGMIQRLMQAKKTRRKNAHEKKHPKKEVGKPSKPTQPALPVLLDADNSSPKNLKIKVVSMLDMSNVHSSVMPESP